MLSAKNVLPLLLTFLAIGAGEGEGGPDRLLILVGCGGSGGFCCCCSSRCFCRYFFGRGRRTSSSGGLGCRLGLQGCAKTIWFDLVVKMFLDMIKKLIVGPVVEGTVVLGADIAAGIAFEHVIFDVVADAVRDLLYV